MSPEERLPRREVYVLASEERVYGAREKKEGGVRSEKDTSGMADSDKNTSDGDEATTSAPPRWREQKDSFRGINWEEEERKIKLSLFLLPVDPNIRKPPN